MNIKDIEKALKIKEQLEKSNLNQQIMDELIEASRKQERLIEQSLGMPMRQLHKMLTSKNQPFLKEVEQFGNNFRYSTYRNENLQVINSLRKMNRIENFHIPSLSPKNPVIPKLNFFAKPQYAFQIEQNKLPLSLTNEIYSALSLKQSEIDRIFNDGLKIRDRLNQFPNNFQRQEFWKEIDKIRNTFVGSLAISMREAIDDSANNEEAVEKIESLYEEKVAPLPKNRFIRKSILKLFLTLLIATVQIWYAYYLSEQSSIEINTLFEQTMSRLEKIDKRLERIEKQLSDDDFYENEEVFYMVKRTVSAKSKPSFKSLTVDYLEKDTKVRLIKSKHKWIYIEYLDYLEVIPRTAWVSKKYLKRIQ